MKKDNDPSQLAAKPRLRTGVKAGSISDPVGPLFPPPRPPPRDPDGTPLPDFWI